MSKFTVYAHTRAVRQECDDTIENLLKANPCIHHEVVEQWYKVEQLLQDAESALEHMNLQEV